MHLSEDFSARKITLMLVLMAAITQAALVLYTPAFVAIGVSLHISPALVKTTLSAYLLGFGVSQLVYGPLSDRVGRKKPLLGGMFLLTLGALLNVFSQSYSVFLIARVIQGVGAGSCMALSRSVLRDVFSGPAYLKAASFLSSGFAIGLGLTPIIGGVLMHFYVWQADFIFLAVLGVICFFLFLFFLPETLTHKQDKGSVSHFLQYTFKNMLLALSNLRFFAYLIGGVLAYGVVIVYNVMGPFLFQDSMGYLPVQYGFLTFFIAISYYLGTSLNRYLIDRLLMNTILKIGLFMIVLSGALVFLSYCFSFFNLWLVYLPLLFATMGQAFIWSNCIANALKDLSHIAGTAAAVFGFLQMLLSALLSVVIALPNDATQLPLSIVIIILGVVSWFLFKVLVFKRAP